MGEIKVLREIPWPHGAKVSSYKPEYCSQLIDDMRDGYSIGAFAGKIGVGRSVILNWMDAYPEFALAVSIGKALRQRKWEEASMDFAFGQVEKGSAAMLKHGLQSSGSEDWKTEDVNVNLKGSLTTLNYDPEKFSRLSDEELRSLEQILCRVTIDSNVVEGGTERTGAEGESEEGAITSPGQEIL